MTKYTSAFVLFIACSVVQKAQPPSDGYITAPDKIKLFYKTVGTGSETLVAVHGGPGNSLESIRADLEPLAKNRRVIYYDQRGQGRSEVIADAKKLGYEKYVADLEAVRKHFRLEKMSLIGNSWGGLLISLYAIKYPERIERMILHSPAPPSRAFDRGSQQEIERRMQVMYTAEERERISFIEKPDNWLAASDVIAMCQEFHIKVLNTYTFTRRMDNIGFKGDLCAGPKESVRQWRSVNYAMWRSLGEFDLVPKLGVVKAPVLVIHGVADVIPQRGSEAWASGYPNGRLMVIEKAGHLTHVERADVFFPAVENFLKGSSPF